MKLPELVPSLVDPTQELFDGENEEEGIGEMECDTDVTDKESEYRQELVTEVSTDSDLWMPPVGWPAEAGVCPPGQKTWTVHLPGGGKIAVITYQKAFYVHNAPKGQRHVSWNHYEDYATAWNKAKWLGRC